MAELNDDTTVDDIETDDDIELDDDTQDDDTTDWKAEAEKARGIAQRYKTKLEKAKLDKAGEKKETKKEEKETKLDYGQKAYLIANGIKGADEVALVKEYLDRTGKELEDIIESKHFQNDLKELKEAATTKAATPSSSKRSNSSARDQVDYWVNKGELPPIEDVELRRQVVNAKIKAKTDNSHFYNSQRS